MPTPWQTRDSAPLPPTGLAMDFLNGPISDDFPYTPEAFRQSPGRFRRCFWVWTSSTLRSGVSRHRAGIQYALQNPDRVGRLVL